MRWIPTTKKAENKARKINNKFHPHMTPSQTLTLSYFGVGWGGGGWGEVVEIRGFARLRLRQTMRCPLFFSSRPSVERAFVFARSRLD